LEGNPEKQNCSKLEGGYQKNWGSFKKNLTRASKEMKQPTTTKTSFMKIKKKRNNRIKKDERHIEKRE